MSGIEGWPHFRGEFALESVLWGISKWPQYRGGLISGVQVRGSSLLYLFSYEGGEVGSHNVHLGGQVLAQTLPVLSQLNHSGSKPLNVDQVDRGDVHSYVCVHVCRHVGEGEGERKWEKGGMGYVLDC